MENNIETPAQETGGSSDVIEKTTATGIAEAKKLFGTVKQRLLDINHWGSISEGISASFDLTDALGAPKEGLPIAGDHLRINIPGPGLKAGEGYDWVRIEKLQEQRSETEDVFMMQVRPSANPSPATGEEIAHFFDEKATSSFIVRRHHETVSAEVHGRNEEPNTSNEKLTDKIRNAVVGISAMAGFSAIQWKKLVKGLLELPEHHN
jgi:hypothetical protein